MLVICALTSDSLLYSLLLQSLARNSMTLLRLVCLVEKISRRITLLHHIFKKSFNRSSIALSVPSKYVGTWSVRDINVCPLVCLCLGVVSMLAFTQLLLPLNLPLQRSWWERPAWCGRVSIDTRMLPRHLYKLVQFSYLLRINLIY